MCFASIAQHSFTNFKKEDLAQKLNIDIAGIEQLLCSEENRPQPKWCFDPGDARHL